MFPETLYPKTRTVLTNLEKTELDVLNDFYLAGGTALALQIGHRKSADLDFFTADFPNREILLQKMRSANPTVTQEAPGTLDLLINNVKVSFLQYIYPLLQETHSFENIQLADTLDIACMKMSAISSRGSKKDFVDLYVILQDHYTLSELFNAFEEKFQDVQYNKMHILKSLVYFEDAEDDPTPDYLEHIEWDTVKNHLIQEVQQYYE